MYSSCQSRLDGSPGVLSSSARAALTVGVSPLGSCIASAFVIGTFKPHRGSPVTTDVTTLPSGVVTVRSD